MFEQSKKILLTSLLFAFPILITLFLKYEACAPSLTVERPKYQLIFAAFYQDAFFDSDTMSPSQVDLSIWHAKMAIPSNCTDEQCLQKHLSVYSYDPYMNTIRYLEWKIVNKEIIFPELLGVQLNHEPTSPDGYTFSIVSLLGENQIALNKQGNLIKLHALPDNSANYKVSLIGWNISKKYPYCKKLRGQMLSSS